MGQTLIGILQKSSRYNRPNQIAWAIVWGCACGLLPKSSLLFPLGMLISMLLPIHLVAAMVCMVAVSCVNAILHPTLGNLGHILFGSMNIGSIVESIDAYPLMPWFKLHNTVVAGALVVSLFAALPAYWVIHRVVTGQYVKWLRVQFEVSIAQAESQCTSNTSEGIQVGSGQAASVQLASVQAGAQIDSLMNKVVKDNLIPAGHSTTAAQTSGKVLAAQLTDASTKSSSMRPRPPVVSPEVEPRPLAAALDKFDASMLRITANSQLGNSEDVASSVAAMIDSIHALENLLEQADQDTIEPIDARAVLARATKASELVDDILQSLDACESATAMDVPTASNNRSIEAMDASSSDTTARPTTVEAAIESPVSIDSTANSRLRIDAPQTFQSHDTKISIYRRARTGETTVSSSDNKAHLEKEQMQTAQETLDPSSNMVVVPTMKNAPTSRTTSVGAVVEPGNARPQSDARHEEALRHLLSHLRALKEKV